MVAPIPPVKNSTKIFFTLKSLEVDYGCELKIYICMNPVIFILVDTESECLQKLCFTVYEP